MKKFEAISKQIDAMIEILKKEDMTAQDAKNIALTVLEWDKEYLHLTNLPVRKATSLAFLFTQEGLGDYVEYEKEQVIEDLEHLQMDMTQDYLNNWKSWHIKEKLLSKKNGADNMVEYHQSMIDSIDKLLAFNWLGI